MGFENELFGNAYYLLPPFSLPAVCDCRLYELEDVDNYRFHPEGNAISAGFSNNAVEIWDVRSDRVVQHYKAHTKPITSVSFHPKGNFLLSSSKDSTLKVSHAIFGRKRERERERERERQTIQCEFNLPFPGL